MKKIYIIIAILLIACCSYAQDKLDPKRLFRADTMNNTIKPNANGFVLGWNWGSIGSRFDEALNMNYYF